MIELTGRFFRWFVRMIGGMTLVRLVLLSLVLVCVERGLIAIVGHIHTEWLTATAIYGLMAGWILGRSRLPGWEGWLVVAGCRVGLADYDDRSDEQPNKYRNPYLSASPEANPLP